MNISDNIKKIIVGSVILIISAFIGYRFLDKKSIENNSQPKIVIKEDNIINDYLEKEFSKVLKIFSGEVKKSAQSMVKFNDKFLLKNDYLNFRNSLYTKDIEKHSLLVDTKNMCHCKDKHSYIFSMTNNDNNETGGLDVYKNVIGFRLIKATLQNLHYTIHDANNKLKIKVGNNTDTITLDKKVYDSEVDIATQLQTQLDNSSITSTVSVSFDENTRKFTITESSGNLEILFEQTTNDKSSIFRLLGFNNIDTTAKNTHVSDNVSDISIHFVDLVVSEIPYIACKKNPSGKSIIDRIPIDSSTNSLVHYRAPETDYFSQNYFYPITLSELTIDLFEDSNNIPFFNESADNFFEFEITILKNTKLSN